MGKAKWGISQDKPDETSFILDSTLGKPRIFAAYWGSISCVPGSHGWDPQARGWDPSFAYEEGIGGDCQKGHESERTV